MAIIHSVTVILWQTSVILSHPSAFLSRPCYHSPSPIHMAIPSQTPAILSCSSGSGWFTGTNSTVLGQWHMPASASPKGSPNAVVLLGCCLPRVTHSYNVSNSRFALNLALCKYYGISSHSGDRPALPPMELAHFGFWTGVHTGRQYIQWSVLQNYLTEGSELQGEIKVCAKFLLYLRCSLGKNRRWSIQCTTSNLMHWMFCSTHKGQMKELHKIAR